MSLAMQTISNEICSPVMLCSADGRLNPDAIGWSRQPLHVCNLKGRFGRKKRWDYWCITSDRLAFSATIANVDYMAIGSACLLLFDSNRFATQTTIKPFPRTPVMPPVVSGDVIHAHKKLSLAFHSIGTGVRIAVRSEALGGQPLNARLDIFRPEGHESLNVVVPWNPRTFQFTSKQHCLPTGGTIVWGRETFTLDPGAAFACLDYGRGIWPYRTTWNWAAFSGRAGQDIVGINMGGRWTDGTGMNENGILLNGRLHKIFDDILFEYDRTDFMAPWRMRTGTTPVVDLTFAPFYDRAEATNLLLLSSSVHQVFGRYTGTLRVDDRVIRVEGLLGWAEEHIARW